MLSPSIGDVAENIMRELTGRCPTREARRLLPVVVEGPTTCAKWACPAGRAWSDRLSTELMRDDERVGCVEARDL